MIGQKLGQYQITELLGKGGMGEVYRAHDTKLDRDIALKVLPREMSADPERVSRFQREARTLASLQHANVASIYGFEDLPEARFLVMELVEGEDLSERMTRGAFEPDEVVSIAGQLCEGLAAAHDRGIVHRDLKPANIKLMADGTVKILDFGLARAYVGDNAAESELANSPTITAAMTAAGVILGTAAYMSPEQARGRPVNQLADIWALGVILWEMLQGERLFEGDTVSDTLAAVLKSPVDFDAMPASTPPNLQAVVRRCLERDPKERFQHAGDVRWALASPEFGAATKGGVEAERRPSRPWAWIAATVALAAIAAFGLLRGGSSGPASQGAPLIKFEQPITEDSEFGAGNAHPEYSPDGTQVAYSAGPGILLRLLSDLEVRVVPGTEGATLPFWSPDGQWLGYAQNNRLMKVSVSGGTAVPVINSLSAAVGSAQLAGTPVWGADGFIEMATGNSGLYRVSERGGTPEISVPVNVDQESDFHAFVQVPGGGRFVIVHLLDGGYGFVDFVAPDGQRTSAVRVEGGSVGDLAWSPTGHLVFQASHPTEGLWALPFSLEEERALGPAFLVAAGATEPTVSRQGTLVYVRSSAQRGSELVWVDRAGQRLSVIARVETSRPFPDLSADDTQVVLSILGTGTGRSVMVFDATREGVGQTLARDGRSYEMSRFTPWPDKILTYTGSPFGIFHISTRDGSVTELVEDRGMLPNWTRDGSHLIYMRMSDEGFSGNLVAVERDAPASTAVQLTDRPGPQWFAEPSPDGKFLAYTSSEEGLEQVYVTTFPDPGPRWRVSSAMGAVPRWASDGSQLYWTERYALMVCDVTHEGSTIEFGPPRKLFDRRPINWSEAYLDGYAVSSDGQRFVMVEPSAEAGAEPARLVVVQNWVREFE